MVFPLVAFAVGLVILFYMFDLGWTRGSLSEDESALLRYLLAGLALCVLAITVWGIRSESLLHRKRWAGLCTKSLG